MGEKISISGIEPEHIVEHIVDRFWRDYGISERVEEQLKDLVRSHLDSLVRQSIESEAREIVREHLTNGWKLHNTYGGDATTVTLTQRIEEALKRKFKRGGWNSKDPERSFIDNTVLDVVEDYVKGELRNDLKEARESFRKQVNKVLQSKLAETLAEHLGVGGKS